MYYFVVNYLYACAYTYYTRVKAYKCTKKSLIMPQLFVFIDFFYNFVRCKQNILI